MQTNIVQYCLILSNIAKYHPIVIDIAQYGPVLFDIAQVIVSAQSYHKYDIVRNIEILSNIVQYIQILFSIDQYCPVAPCLDIFPLKLNLSHFKSDLDAVKNWLFASMQLYEYVGM